MKSGRDQKRGSQRSIRSYKDTVEVNKVRGLSEDDAENRERLTFGANKLKEKGKNVEESVQLPSVLQ
jgi:hypothetical protein